MEKPDYINIPTYLSDVWIESNYEKFKSTSKQTLALDFSECEWIELSALLSITGLIVQNIVSFPKIDILFAAAEINQTKDKRNAFLFLIESNFFIAINKASRDNNGLCSIWFKLNTGDNETILKIREKLALNFSLNQNKSDEINNILPIRRSKKDGYNLLGIILHKIQINLKIDISSFSILGYRPEKQRDQFIIPIKYFSVKELKSIIKEKELLTIIRNDLFNEVDIKNIIEFAERKETFNDIQSVYLVELISNAIEHAGDESDVILTLRLGNWEHRSEKKISGIEYWGECYNYKSSYFEANKERIGEKFIDFHILDTGQGFKSLSKTYELYRKNQDSPIISLHRFALFPHTSSKSRLKSSNDDNLRITGLGVIAENIILHDGLITIKDKDGLSYFDSTSLRFISNTGKNESKSKADMNHTNISILIPVRDETWIVDNIVRKLKLVNSSKNTLIFFKATKIKPLEFDNFLLFDSDIKNFIRKEFKNIYRIQVGTFGIVDITNISNVFDKNISIRLRDFILTLKKVGIVVILYGGNISLMKILQSTIDSDRKLNDLNIQSLFADSTILCPIITSDFKLFFCGHLDNNERLELFEFFNEDKIISESTLSLINEWSHGVNYMPFASIERCINHLRGIEFKNDIERSRHYYRGIIQDIHGNYLDSFYEVKTYFSTSENRKKWKDDFVRFLAKFEPEIIIVDSPELRLILTEIITDLELNIKVGRINNKTIEFPNIEINHNSSILIILSCAFSGSVLDSIPEYKKKYKLKKVNTLTILDLTGCKRTEIEKLIEGSYDRFSIGNAPKKIDNKEINPDYFSTSRARIVPSEVMRKELDNIFKPYIPKHSLFAALNQSSQVFIGHTIEHEHHYDVFVDVRSAILFNDRLSQHFRNLLQNRINLGRNIIVYPEDSELDPILNSVKYAPGNKKIQTIPIRRVDEETFIWSNLSHKKSIEGKKIIFLDEGIYSCNSLIGIIKLLLKENPGFIDVIVLEKRLSYDMSSINFLKAFQPDLGKCKIDYFCVIEIFAPTYSSNSCPYCKIGILEELKSPKKISDYVKIDEEIASYNYEYLLWLLSSIYYSRSFTISCINQVKLLFQESISAYFYLINLLIIHNKVIQRWNLYKELFEIIRLMFSCSKVFSIVNVLRSVKQTEKSFTAKFIEHLIQELIFKIDNHYIYYELSDILLFYPELIPLINNKIKALVLPDTIQNLWDILQEQKNEEKIFRAVNYLFMVTKINKSHPHTTIPQDILLYGLENPEIKTKIQILNDIVQLLEPSPPVIKQLNSILFRDLNQLQILFDDELYVKELINQYSVSSIIFLEELNKIVDNKNRKIDYSPLYRIKSESITEIPLLCLQKEHYILLKEHFRENIGYGNCELSFEKNNDIISFICLCKEPKKIITSETVFDSQSKKNINNILLPYGGSLEYYLVGSMFKSVLNLKIVDYGKYEVVNNRR